MSDGRKYYCFCEANCKFETMNKEQILAAIAQAAENGLVFDVDAAFISKVKEKNAGGYITFWMGTEAQYNALTEKDANCVYIKTGSLSLFELEKKVMNCVEKTGGTMAGALAMSGNKITDLGVPTEDTDAATKGYADKKVPKCTLVDVSADLDNYKSEGVFFFSNNATHTNIPAGVNGWLDVKVANNAVKQIWYRFGTPNSSDYGTFIRTYAPSTGWGEWFEVITSKHAHLTIDGETEWIKPPMELGIEYRTTERYMGKPVYTKLVNCGKPVNSSDNETSAEIGVVATIIRHCANYDGRPIDAYTNADLKISYRLDGTANNIITGVRIIKENEKTIVGEYLNTYVQVWYTKA